MTINFQTTDNIEQCLEIRHQVFVLGQNVPPDLEVDGLDETARHYIGLDQDIGLNQAPPIATCRIRFIDSAAKIERVAVLASHRGQGIGRKLMEYVIIALADEPDINIIKVSAQIAVVPFYESLGFTAYGPTYPDAGIEHVDMQRPARL
jgi:predicted GNAT family N-acyltransferase